MNLASGELTNTMHGVSGKVYSGGPNKLKIKGFNYDGNGNGARLMVGSEQSSMPASTEIMLPYAER